MFRIQRDYVNLASSNQNDGSAGAAGPYGTMTPASAVLVAQETIENAHAEAEQIIAQARAAADTIFENAQDELDRRRNDAWHSGYEDGAIQGRQSYDAALQENEQSLARLLSDISQASKHALEGMEDRLAALSIEIAKKIIDASVIEGEGVFKSIVEKALKQVNLEGKLTIKVGPREYERFFPTGNEVFDLGGGVTVTASVVRDMSLGEGDCVIDTESETLNAGIGAQLKMIELEFSRADEL